MLLDNVGELVISVVTTVIYAIDFNVVKVIMVDVDLVVEIENEVTIFQVNCELVSGDVSEHVGESVIAS